MSARPTKTRDAKLEAKVRERGIADREAPRSPRALQLAADFPQLSASAIAAVVEVRTRAELPFGRN